MAEKKAGIGEGLDVLFSLSKNRANTPSQPTVSVINFQQTTHCLVPINSIEPCPYQPRKTFLPAMIDELAASIREHGIIQPIILRQKPANGREHYELIAGERRWRAAKRAGLNEVPAIVKQIDDQTVAAFSLIENIQRENLNPIEEAHAYQKLIDEFELTHDEVAKRVGKPRATISNFLRLLRLQKPIQQWLVEKRLDMGHAKVLLSLNPEQQLGAGQMIVQRGLSVRQTEAFIRQLQQPANQNKRVDVALLERADDLAAELGQLLGKHVDIKLKGAADGKGQLKMNFRSLDELQRLIERLRKG